VRTPEGRELEVMGTELAEEIARLCGQPVQMMQLRQGVFDEASVSVITTGTVAEVARASGTGVDERRFRPNVVVRTLLDVPFEEIDWVGKVLLFGDDQEGPAVSVTMQDERCAMVNLDPDSARSTPEIMKAIVRRNENNAGIYGAVIRKGLLRVGQTVRLHDLR
jgi:hypothetical protein